MWHNIHVTDKTGSKFWNSNVTPCALDGAIRELERHISNAKRKAGYEFLDVSSAKIVIDGVANCEMSDDEILKELGL